MPHIFPPQRTDLIRIQAESHTGAQAHCILSPWLNYLLLQRASSRVATPEPNVPLKPNTLRTINSQTSPVASVRKKRKYHLQTQAHTHCFRPFTHGRQLSPKLFCTKRQREDRKTRAVVSDAYKDEQKFAKPELNSIELFHLVKLWVGKGFLDGRCLPLPIQLHVLFVSSIMSNNFASDPILQLTSAYPSIWYVLDLKLCLVSRGVRSQFIWRTPAPPGAKKYDAMLRVGQGHGRVTECWWFSFGPCTYMVNYHCCCWDHFPTYTLSVWLKHGVDPIWRMPMAWNVQPGFNLFT